MTSILVLAILQVLITLIIQNTQVTSQLFLGGRCTFGGYSNVEGECKQLANCPSAISNFRAGISPSLCYQENDLSVICCQSEKRISEKKCDEYSKRIAELQSNGPSFSPLNGGSYEGPNSNRQSNEESGCNGAKFSAFIVGGRNAEKYEMSFTVALGLDNGNGINWFCGGTLISDQYVVTAAHCLDGRKSSPPNVILLGDKSLKKLDAFSSQHRVEAKVSEIIIHPEYQRPMKYNDIGLIKLDRKVNFNRAVVPACLPQPESRPETINNFLIAGWGRIAYFGKRAETLQMANIDRMSQRDCNKAYKTGEELPNGIAKTQICAGDSTGNKDSCDGDSGGPLVTNLDKSTCMQTIIGLVSFGDTFCGESSPAVYTNIQSYLDWIEGVVWSDEIDF